MIRYLVGRLVSSLLVLLLLSLVVFAMVRLVPGDPTAAFVDPANPDPAQVAALRAQLGLDRPFLLQYLSWLADLLHGDLGEAITMPSDVQDLIASRLPLSLALAVLAAVFGVAIGVPAGALSAITAGRAGDHVARALSFAFLATPPFVLGTVLVLLNSVTLRLPLIGWTPFEQDPVAALRSLLLPALLLGLALAALVCRHTRNNLLEVLQADFIRTARAKGADPRRLVRGHALRNALIPVTTVVGLEIATLVGGTVVTEQVFALPGMGTVLVGALKASDYPVIQASVLVLGAIYVLINLVVDLVQPFVDPRVRVHG